MICSPKKLIPEPKHTPTKHTPPSLNPNTHPVKEAYQPLETIPASADGKSEKHATHLNSQRRAMRY